MPTACPGDAARAWPAGPRSRSSSPSGARRRAALRLRPHRLVEPLPLSGGERAEACAHGGRVRRAAVGLRRCRPTPSCPTAGSRARTAWARERQIGLLPAAAARSSSSSSPRRRADALPPRRGRPARLRSARRSTGPRPSCSPTPAPASARCSRAACARSSTPHWSPCRGRSSSPRRAGDRPTRSLPAGQPGCGAPDGERPPLIVLSHGGPTAAADAELDLEIQFFTSRGFAVVDVDYGGSTGYGRAYRAAAARAAGAMVDVDDCVAAAARTWPTRGWWTRTAWPSAAAAPAATPRSARSPSTTSSPPGRATTAWPTPRPWPATRTSSSRATSTA